MLTRGLSAMFAEVSVDLQRLLADKFALGKLSVPAFATFLLRMRFGLYTVLASLGSKLDWHDWEARLASEPRTLAACVSTTRPRGAPLRGARDVSPCPRSPRTCRQFTVRSFLSSAFSSLPPFARSGLSSSTAFPNASALCL
jgi:hypothetical protein